jgi:ABC-type Fe3+-hydroxamate transport system substrate-binding protein
MSLICENEVIRLLGAQDRVVGIDKWTIMLHTEDLPVISKQPCIGSFMPGEVDYEKILEIADQTEGQDIVITYAASWAEDIEEILDPIEGIEVVRFDFYEPDILVPQLKQLAIMLGEKEKCQEYINWRNDILDQIEDQVQEIPPEERVKVFFDASGEGHFDTQGLPDAAGNELISLAGGKSISEDLGIDHTIVDPEWVLVEDPEVIVSHEWNARTAVGVGMGYSATTVDYPKLEEARQELMGTYGIAGTDATVDGRVYFITDGLMYGPQQPVERFDDLEPQEQNRKYYEEFMDLEYLGIHVYPEE